MTIDRCNADILPLGPAVSVWLVGSDSVEVWGMDVFANTGGRW